MKRDWIPALLLGLLLTFGSYLRLASLGAGDFGVDELYQVFAAEAIARGEGPRLPSGELYERGLEVTHLVRYSFDALGASEFSARLPSALLGILSLFLFAAVLWAMGGAWIAVVGTALLAIYPEAVLQSRQLRFYTYQLTLGILAFYAGWRALRHAAAEELPDPRRLLQGWAWALATLLLLFLAARVQLVSLSVLAAWLSIVAVAAAADLIEHGRGAWRRSMPIQLLVSAAIVTAVVFLFRDEAILSLWRRARSVPLWVLQADGGTHPLAYYYGLVGTFPLLVALLPLIVLAAVALRPRLGLYVVLWFAVPLFLHSFVLTWKGGRFVMVPMLGLFAATAIVAAWGGHALYRNTRERASRLLREGPPAAAVAAIVVAVVASAAYVTLPAFNESRRMVGGGTSRWSAMAKIIRSHPELRNLPYAHRRPLHPRFYWGRIDFVVGQRRLAASTQRGEEGDWEVEYLPVGTADRSAGAPVLTTPEAIRNRFATFGAVLIGAEADGDSLVDLTPELSATLRSEAEELCQGRCGPSRLFLWRFGAPTDAAVPADRARSSVRRSVGSARTRG